MSEEQATNEGVRKLPDMKICRAKDMRIAGFCDCLVEKPYECPYSLSFGGGFFCYHPKRNEIIQNTNNGRKKRDRIRQGVE